MLLRPVKNLNVILRFVGPCVKRLGVDILRKPRAMHKRLVRDCKMLTGSDRLFPKPKGLHPKP